MKYRTLQPLCLLLFSLFIFELPAQEAVPAGYLRGDDGLEFRWRFGYSEYPIDPDSRIDQRDAARGTYGWYSGLLWSGGYSDWENETVHGVNLLFRSGSPYARSVRATSEPVPVGKAGYPQTFAIPLCYSLGSEERMSVALRVIGQEEEAMVLNLSPEKQVSAIGGRLKVTFHTLRLEQPEGERPFVKVSGMLHIRVYPGLLKYGERMVFEFNSLTRHMDVESGMWIGSLWKDLSRTDVEASWKKSGLTDDILDKAALTHQERLNAWNRKAADISARLNRPGKIVVSCSAKPEPWDRGELRVQAYSGNPVKDYQYGPVTGRVEEMARSLVTNIGHPFTLFRYQHHRLPWIEKQPEALNPDEVVYLDQWLRAASGTAEQVVLDLQLSPVVKAYKAATQMGTKPLPEEGIPGFTWDNLCQGYETTFRHAKSVCPQLRIVQMPYEFDNISDTECHRDAHYRIFKALCKAVNKINRGLPEAEQLQVAGLGSNTPYHWGFIDGFLQRFSSDPDPEKRLDFITWHTYLFPGTAPNICKGFRLKLEELLKKNNLPLDLPVLVDESGLAEPSTIEDLSDLQGASRKEAAMACFTASIHHWYLKEKGNFIPVTGAGLHFGLLTYGKQHVLSPYAKGMILRNRLYDGLIPSEATPCDERGYGLYSQATAGDDSYKVLVWTASPAIFYKKARPLSYPATELLLQDLPASFRNKPVRITIESVDPSEAQARSILGLEKCQTLPLTRGADRYEISFTPAEAETLNAIPAEVRHARVEGKTLSVPLDVKEYAMYLVKVELEKQ